MNAIGAPQAGSLKRVAVVGICLDALTYRSVSQSVTSVSGGIACGNLDRYIGIEREIGRALDGAHCRVCLLDLDQNPDEAIWAIERLRAEHPDVFIFAVSAQSDPERIIAAMRNGCAEYLIKPIQTDRLINGLQRAEAKEKEKTRSKTRGKVTTLLGAKGGTGVTTLALHLALHLTGNNARRCLLIDQHAALGDSSLYLGTGRHKYSFYELAGNTDRLDEELLAGFLLHHESGLHLLDSPESLDSVHYAPPAAIEQTLGFLAETYQYLVIDCAPGLTDSTVASISQSDQVAIVLTAELPSVRNTVRYLEHLEKLGYNRGNVRIILNRHSKKGPLSDERIEKAIQQPIWLRVPNCYQEVVRAINAGMPVLPGDRSEFAAAMEKWSKDIVGSTTIPAAAGAAAGSDSQGKLLSFFKR